MTRGCSQAERQRVSNSPCAGSIPVTRSEFWKNVEKSALLIKNNPAWTKAGITLNPIHYITYHVK